MQAGRDMPNLVLASLLLGAALSGCVREPTFPRRFTVRADHSERVYAYDTNRDRRADYWQYQTGERKTAVAIGDDQSAPGPRIELDSLSPADCPHYVLILDGVPFDLVARMYQAGHFRLFHPPTRVITGFPVMTDLALSDLLHTERNAGYQALYFDRAANKLSDGNRTYLCGESSAWRSRMAFRASLWWDVLVYLDPQTVFQHELNGAMKALRAADSGEALVYSVGTAGLGTRGGAPAIEKYLETVDRLCEQIVYERRGRVKITVTADHGHNLVENHLVRFEDHLKRCGYHPAERLRTPQDVVLAPYGLVTYAELFTHDPAGVAACIVRHDDVDFACYRDGDGVVVLNRDGRARITRGPRGYTYDPAAGDPLGLAPILAQLRVSGQISPTGEIEDAALFDATVEHEYPDPLARLWRGLHDLVDHPADVLVNLRDGAAHGSRFFHAMIGKARSTHGSLNRLNSTTFVLTMLGELPPALRTEDVMAELAKLRGEGH